jgi:hypothetical protein
MRVEILPDRKSAIADGGQKNWLFRASAQDCRDGRLRIADRHRFAGDELRALLIAVATIALLASFMGIFRPRAIRAAAIAMNRCALHVRRTHPRVASQIRNAARQKNESKGGGNEMTNHRHALHTICLDITRVKNLSRNPWFWYRQLDITSYPVNI